MKPGRYHVGPDHLSKIVSSQLGGVVDVQLPYADIFKVESIPYSLEEIAFFWLKDHPL